MNAEQMLRYLSDQSQEIEDLINQLDEIQVHFNAQYDSFKSQHDAVLDHLTNQIDAQLDTVDLELRKAIEDRLPEERERINERRQQVAQEYLPKRREAEDALLKQAQAELAQLRSLNPQLNEREESLKRGRAELDARLAELNRQIRAKSRGLGVMLHFIAISKADRERHRLLGKIEAINESLYRVRTEWKQHQQEAEQSQKDLQQAWQLESIAVARLQTELDQLDDADGREELALRRAIRHCLDALKEPATARNPELEAGLHEMVDLNIQTDAYHDGLASVGGLIGLLRGINSGMQAIHRSVEGVAREAEMHSAYLRPVSFDISKRVATFHNQWAELVEKFSDEKGIGQHPAGFADSIRPLLAGPLSEANIEAMFADLGASITEATAAWD